jgi:hypothetical protein
MAMASLNLGFFSLAMFVLYLAFIPWKAAERLPDTAKHVATKLWAPSRRTRISEASTEPPSGHIEAAELPVDERVNASPVSRKVRGKHAGFESVDEIDSHGQILTQAHPDERRGS